MLGAVARRGHGDGHAADRINLGARRGNGLGRKGLRLRVPQLDDLRQDAQGDLFRKARADVEPGGVLDAVERLVRHAAREQRLAQLREALAAGDHRQVRGADRER